MKFSGGWVKSGKRLFYIFLISESLQFFWGSKFENSRVAVQPTANNRTVKWQGERKVFTSTKKAINQRLPTSLHVRKWQGVIFNDFPCPSCLSKRMCLRPSSRTLARYVRLGCYRFTRMKCCTSQSTGRPPSFIIQHREKQTSCRGTNAWVTWQRSMDIFIPFLGPFFLSMSSAVGEGSIQDPQELKRIFYSSLLQILLNFLWIFMVSKKKRVYLKANFQYSRQQTFLPDAERWISRLIPEKRIPTRGSFEDIKLVFNYTFIFA